MMKFTFNNSSELVEEALELDYFQEFDGDVVIPYLWKKGRGDLVLVVGENASGKSFFRRIIREICRQASQKTECISISMEGRREVAYNIGLAFVYGDEAHQATGENSAHTVIGGITTSQSRTNRHVIFWDEPDIGLSDSWAAGMGQRLAEFAKEKSKHRIASFIVTHSKVLVRELLDLNPHYLHLGMDADKAPQSLQEWVERPVKAKNIDNLSKESLKRFRAIQKILNSKKK